ncbi:MAG: ParM/StbA family protein [Leptolyngbyaceae cyanobacterium bins.59]|nr:ParM/StbA family protein [Leptolyngbyaceae cyanobacterium bins.59]
MNTTTSVLNVFIDLGSSLIKVCYLYGDRPYILLMPPHLNTTTERRLKSVIDANPDSYPEDIAWMQVKDQILSFGSLAQQLGGSPTVKRRKSEVGVYRVLAVLGILQDSLGLPSQFSCNLGVALPVAEYGDRDAFASQLREDASQMTFRNNRLKVSFNVLDVQVEGMGLVRDRRAELIAQSNLVQNIVALMFGHRNLSVLSFSGSALQLESCTSSGPGFIKAVEVLARELSVEPNVPGLVEIAALGLSSYRFEGSIQPRDTRLAVAEAKSQYWLMVQNHLNEVLPGGNFEVIAAGGALPVIRPELQGYFSSVGLGDRVSYADKLQKKLIKTLSAEQSTRRKLNADPVLSVRLLDAFVGMQALILKSKQSPSSQPTMSKVLPIHSKRAGTGDSVVDRMSEIL